MGCTYFEVEYHFVQNKICQKNGVSYKGDYIKNENNKN